MPKILFRTGPDSDGKWEEDHAKISVSVKGVDESRIAAIRAPPTSAVSAVIFAAKYPGKVIDIEVTVLSDDGGVLATALNAVTLALAHSGIENMGITASCHVALTSNHEYVTDPSLAEASNAIGGITFGFVPNLTQATCVDVHNIIKRIFPGSFAY
uniref:RNase_PH domain-containing protein n=1 Tax=Caenorhabditis japonica TaxID=281687 RepID=A0A8R1EY73_CAEJA